MRRLVFLLVAVAASALVAAPVAPGGSKLSSTESIDAAGTLTVSFDETNLRKLPSVDYLLDATGTAIWSCADGTSVGSQFPASNTITGLTPDAKGHVGGSLAVQVASIGGTICTSAATLTSVSWTSVTLTNLTTGKVYALASISQTFP